MSVEVRNTHTISPMAIMNRNETGMPGKLSVRNTRPVPSFWKNELRTPTGFWSGSMKKAMPLNSCSVPSVVITGLTRSTLTHMPLNPPSTSPATTAITIAGTAGQPCNISTAATTPATAAVAPTEMSRPPARMTRVSPAASRPMTAMASPTFMTLAQLRNNEFSM